MPDAYDVIRRLGGTADWRQLLRHSTGASVRSALVSGDIRRVTRGVYALTDMPLAYPAALAMNGLVSHESAAEHWKMAGAPAGSAHVTVPKQARPRRMRGVKVHFSEVAADDDQGGVTSPRRTVLDCALTLPFSEALAIADSALRLDLVTTEDLVKAASSRRGPGRSRILRVVESADGRAANPFESSLRAILIEAGITGFEPQLSIRGRFFARVDLGHRELKIVIEADSFAFHGSRDALDRDCKRYDELIRSGWLVLRFSWEQVMFEGEWVAEVIRETCALRSQGSKSRSKSLKPRQKAR